MAENRTITLAVTARGLEISVPDGVELLPVQHSEPGEPLAWNAQKELIKAALVRPLSGQSLPELARSRRRVAIVAGDLSYPAPYSMVLPAIVAALVEAGIRPSRIGFVIRPAPWPVLGRGAIHRYGEEIVGDHEVNSWQGDSDTVFDTADLKLAVAPRIGQRGALALLPPGTKIDAAVELELGRKIKIDLVGAQCFAPGQPPAVKATPATGAAGQCDVAITSGGGSEWEETLEEALLGLSEASAPTVVLAFSGSDGLGSAHFTRRLWEILDAAKQPQAADQLPALLSLLYTYADSSAQMPRSIQRLVLLSPGLTEHREGDDLYERINEVPALAERIKLCANPAQLWEKLSAWHGASYRLAVNPLGWRALA